LEVQATHHDALEFTDGTVVPLTKLLPGQHATVLQLPSAADGKRVEAESYRHQEVQI
jgi:hypothetical protein